MTRLILLEVAFGILFPVLGAGCASVREASPQPTASAAAPSSGRIIPANHEAFVYEGRFDRASAGEVGVVWQGSRIRLAFTGESLRLQFGEVQGQNFFDADIDGRITLVELRQGQSPKGIEFENLGVGPHQLTLFKRSEAAAGHAKFQGVQLASDASAMKPKLRVYPVAFQFIGDSITAGACNEDGSTDQWEDRSTHNNALSYGAMTAAAFGADYRNIAVSGMGIATGYTPVKAGEVWDRVYPIPSSPRAEIAEWQPDVLFVNLGENDDSFPRTQNQPFPKDAYTGGYVQLVKELRAAYPSSHIVLLRGGMFGGAKSDTLRSAWETVVSRIEREETNVHHFVFNHWSSNHPRVSDHRVMADELIAWLKQQSFMTGKLR
jgi:lysophospholipase L1-like esterase